MLCIDFLLSIVASELQLPALTWIGIRKDGDLRYPRPDMAGLPVLPARMCIRRDAGCLSYTAQ